MVSLRSGNPTETDAAASKGTKVSSRRTPARRSVKTPGKAPPSTKSKAKKPLSAVKEQQEQEDFLKSSGVHTRAGSPIPAISLSTELPAQLHFDSPSEQPSAPARSASKAVASAEDAEDAEQPSEPALSAGKEVALAEETEQPSEPCPSAGEAQKAAEEAETSTDLSSEIGQGQEGDQDSGASNPALDQPSDRLLGLAERPDDPNAGELASSAEDGSEDLSADEAEPSARLPVALTAPASGRQPGNSLAGGRRVQAAPDLDPSSSSDSDSDAEDDPLGGLAAGMWAALERQRRQPGAAVSFGRGQPGAGSGRNHSKAAAEGKAGAKKSKEGGSRRQGVTGRDQDSEEEGSETEELLWEPETSLPAPLHERDTQAEHLQAAGESGLSKQLVALPRDKKQEAKAARERIGRDWFELPVTQITDEVKRDLRLLRLRGAMDTKRFYKKGDKGKFPARFAVGTVVEGPTEFHSSRLARKDRKRTITEELLADPQLQESRAKRFGKLQDEASRWSHKKAKTTNERIKKRKHAPKH